MNDSPHLTPAAAAGRADSRTLQEQALLQQCGSLLRREIQFYLQDAQERLPWRILQAAKELDTIQTELAALLQHHTAAN